MGRTEALLPSDGGRKEHKVSRESTCGRRRKEAGTEKRQLQQEDGRKEGCKGRRDGGPVLEKPDIRLLGSKTVYYTKTGFKEKKPGF